MPWLVSLRDPYHYRLFKAGSDYSIPAQEDVAGNQSHIETESDSSTGFQPKPGKSDEALLNELMLRLSDPKNTPFGSYLKYLLEKLVHLIRKNSDLANKRSEILNKTPMDCAREVASKHNNLKPFLDILEKLNCKPSKQFQSNIKKTLCVPNNDEITPTAPRLKR